MKVPPVLQHFLNYFLALGGDGQADVPAGLENVVALAAGYYHSLALKSDGTVIGWGKNDDGQIFYLGSQYEMTWSDYAKQKGFHILDTATREVEFIKNPYTIFKKLIYDDTETNYDNINIKPLHQKFIKLIVSNKKDNQMFDRLLERLYNDISVHELKILEDYSGLTHHNVSDDIVEGSEDTMTLVSNYVDQLEVDLNKDKLKVMIKETYVEAQDADPISE